MNVHPCQLHVAMCPLVRSTLISTAGSIVLLILLSFMNKLLVKVFPTYCNRVAMCH